MSGVLKLTNKRNAGIIRLPEYVEIPMKQTFDRLEVEDKHAKLLTSFSDIDVELLTLSQQVRLLKTYEIQVISTEHKKNLWYISRLNNLEETCEITRACINDDQSNIEIEKMMKHKREDAYCDHLMKDLAGTFGDYSCIDKRNELCKRLSSIAKYLKRHT